MFKDVVEKVKQHPQYDASMPVVHFFARLTPDLHVHSHWQVGMLCSDGDVLTFDADLAEKGPTAKPAKELHYLAIEHDFSIVRSVVLSQLQQSFRAQSGFAMLQQEDDGPQWIITLVTPSFETITFRLDALTNEVLSTNTSSLLVHK